MQTGRQAMSTEKVCPVEGEEEPSVSGHPNGQWPFQWSVAISNGQHACSVTHRGIIHGPTLTRLCILNKLERHLVAIAIFPDAIHCLEREGIQMNVDLEAVSCFL